MERKYFFKKPYKSFLISIKQINGLGEGTFLLIWKKDGS